MTKLVIVESPTKAKTIKNFLPKGYEVKACMGHIRDLPQSADEIPDALKKMEWARLGVNVDADFEPLYVVSDRKKKVIKELREALSQADELILATDEDREGESIGWHLVQVLKPKVPTRRMVFHEITREAITEALANPRTVDNQLVRAQETRRILDRLVGYTVSPLLWKKIAPGLSAGRVQSVAVRLLVRREQERLVFRSGSYWDLRALLATGRAGDAPFEATLQSVDGVRVATGKDFDETTGKVIAGKKVLLLAQKTAAALRDRLFKAAWKVESVAEKQQTRKPAPPFTTSTLQQEANRKLRLASKLTMQIAQRLYEQGHITYMRTDSVHLSTEAIGAARRAIESRYGRDYLAKGPRHYSNQAKNAQEAHEAIRPAGTQMRTADEIGLDGQEAALYELIWKRTIASQMADAELTLLTVDIAVEDASFVANGKRIDFPGFFRAYVEGSDNPEGALEDREVKLPALRQADPLTCNKLDTVGHETQPPARYTEASLVQTLERDGIGRPSTYATIISTIQDRDYAIKQTNQLTPTFKAFAVNGLLENHFPDLVDTGFTARMEQALDDIAEGKAQWLPYLNSFYKGEAGLAAQVDSKIQSIDPREIHALAFSEEGVFVRLGRYGPYLEQHNGDQPLRVSLPEHMAPADLQPAKVIELLQRKEEGPNIIGKHPESGLSIVLLEGPYGPYVQLGTEIKEGEKPKRASLLKGMKPEDLTLRVALALLSLPRALGQHPETGKAVSAGVGRFGPFIKHGDEFRSLAATDSVLSIDLARALELLSQPKGGGRQRRVAVLRELGAHPSDNQPVVLLSGPYGPYLKHGQTNAKLPQGASPEALTLAEAVSMLAAFGKTSTKKAASKKASATTTKKPAAKKATTKKPTTKKPTTKSATPKKPAAKKPSRPKNGAE
jgi:DNA topoisomerase I